MKPLFSIFILLFLSNHLVAQKKIIYCLADGTEVSQANSNAYFYKSYVEKDGQLHGSYAEFYVMGGKPKIAGKYKKGQPVGKWKAWYENGQLKKEYSLAEETRESFPDPYREKLINYWTKDGIQLVKAGNGKIHTTHANGTVAWQGYYRNYDKVGAWTYHLPNGFLRHKEIYDNNKVNGTTYLLENEQAMYHAKKINYTQIEVKPRLAESQEALFRYIQKNLRYPTQAKRKGIQGKVIISFFVEKDGSLSNVQVAKRVHELLDAEALRLVKESPKWMQGKERGLSIRKKEFFPFNFKLN
ncbi:MAG: TonB family protein [Flammeovirgaceae bacterium]